ncbi:MAG: prolipoprotein diacylglyceryl transferase [Chloroflexi bacterium]|nr:prolipoprotein diacylglyceryl transferase [Chloroflexota bacterium]
MIDIGIDPIMFRIGPLVLAWHGFFSAVGLGVALWLVGKESKRFGVTEDQSSFIALWGILGAIVGARLFHVVDAWEYYAQRPLSIFLINEGGIAIYGAIVGGVLGGVVAAWWRQWPWGPYADLGGIGLILGQAIGRLGDVINGEHRGTPLEAPWSVRYTHPETLGELNVPVSSAVTYELIWDVVIFVILGYLRFRRPQPGVIFWTYLGLYSVGRFFISFFRYDAIVAMGLAQAQLVAMALAFGSALMVIYLATSKRQEQGEY